MQPWLRCGALLACLVACGEGELGGAGGDGAGPPTAGGAGGAGGASTTGGAGGTGGATCDCPENATCDASGACVCAEGYMGDGATCVDVDECFTQADDCAPTANCVNEPGGYTCECPAGFIGDPLTLCEARYASISAGPLHTCSVRADKSVVCFGNGGSGRLGNGLSVHQPEPVQAGAAFNWAAVRAGSGHTCGIKDTGNLWCWGSNAFGQLGIGTTTNQTLPAYVSLDDTFDEVATGDSHACALRTSGELVCFGRNNQGQLGIGGTVDQLSPVPVSVALGADPPDADWAHVFAGRDSTCAIKTSGRLYCWGRNSDRQIGADSPATFEAPRLVETSAGADDTDWEGGAIASTACAWKTSGALYCWGNNADGELATGTAGADLAAPTLVAAVTDAESVAIGTAHVCAVDGTGDVRCWGRNTSGQIDPALDSPVLAPAVVQTGAREVTAGAGHTCATTSDDRALCWGARTFGQTGSGFGHRTAPEAVPGGGTFGLVEGSANSVVALSAGGALFGAGQNDKAQLGLGNRKPTKVLTQIAGATVFTRAAAGVSHACAISSGDLFCAGDNAFGQLGRTGGAQTSFVAVTTAGKPWAAENFVSLTSGDNHTCALSSTSRLWCFGRNSDGQLGATTPALGDLVEVVAPASTWTHVVAGANHTCARTADAKLRCWGRNVDGQVGTGTTAAAPTPTEIGTAFSGNIAAGVNHTCALKTSGALFCWGENGSSQLGDNTTTDHHAPTAIAAGTSWAKVYAGSAFTCALDAAGQASCWGVNTTGQLGVGDVATRKVPTLVLDGVFTSLALGTAHACGLRADETVACWGSGEFGQNALGVGWDDAPQPPTGGP